MWVTLGRIQSTLPSINKYVTLRLVVPVYSHTSIKMRTKNKIIKLTRGQNVAKASHLIVL